MVAIATSKPRSRPTDPDVQFVDDRVEAAYTSRPVFWATRTEPAPPYLANRFGFGWFPSLLLNSTGMRETRLIVPWWAVAIPATALPAARLRRRLKTFRHKPGHCPACGYDLRATPDRCSECGRGAA